MRLVSCHMPVIPIFGRLRLEDHQFKMKTRLSYRDPTSKQNKKILRLNIESISYY